MLIFFHLVQMFPIWPTNHAYLLRLRLGKDVYIVLASCEDLPSSATEHREYSKPDAYHSQWTDASVYVF